MFWNNTKQYVDLIKELKGQTIIEIDWSTSLTEDSESDKDKALDQIDIYTQGAVYSIYSEGGETLTIEKHLVKSEVTTSNAEQTDWKQKAREFLGESGGISPNDIRKYNAEHGLSADSFKDIKEDW